MYRYKILLGADSEGKAITETIDAMAVEVNGGCLVFSNIRVIRAYKNWVWMKEEPATLKDWALEKELQRV